MQDLPRTFPGHPALDEDGRNALRRLLIAYARHNPSVGYCQVFGYETSTHFPIPSLFFEDLELKALPNTHWMKMLFMDKIPYI